MNIKILYDNAAEPGFKSGWGFSALVDGSTLFDMGENPESLLANMDAFGVKLDSIKRVVFSHEDWDHVGGRQLLGSFGAVKVYVPYSFSSASKMEMQGLNPKLEIVEVSKALDVYPDLIITGQLGTLKREISLAVRTAKGLVLIAGCSHPGLDKIMDGIAGHGRIHAVVGGFHGFRRLKALKDVDLIVPTHCTKKKQELLEMYPEQVRLVAAGMELDI